MYWEGNALAGYLEMGEKNEADAENIGKRLKTAFSKDAFEAYNELIKVTWTGESVDIYAVKIR